MNTVEIKYEDNDEVIVIKRVPNNQFKDLRTLQHLVLTDFISNDAQLGEILAEDSCYTNLVNLAEFMPVVGKGNKKLDPNRMSFEDIKSVFYTQTTPNEDGSYPSEGLEWKPGLIALLHELDYSNTLKKIWSQLMEEHEMKVQKIQQELEEKEKEKKTVLPAETLT